MQHSSICIFIFSNFAAVFIKFNFQLVQQYYLISSISKFSISNFQIVQQQNFSLFYLCNSKIYCKNLNFHVFNLWSSIFQPVLQHHLSAVIIRPFQVDGNQAKKLKKKQFKSKPDLNRSFFAIKLQKGLD